MTHRLERRKSGRFRKALKAICQINGLAYQACTYDISQSGMTLLTPPTLPRARQYLVRCTLPSGTSTIFEVEERHREKVLRQEHRFLRLGLDLLNETVESISFFGELAQATVNQQDPPQHHQDCFSHPAFATIDGHTYQCDTHLGAQHDLALRVPANFPNASVFPLICLDDNGREYQLAVHETRRDPSGPDGELLLTCDILGNQVAFYDFMEGHIT